MALRLIEMVLRERDGVEVRQLLEHHKLLEHRQLKLPDGEVLVRILLDGEESEAVLDVLEQHYSGTEGNRVVILPVEATLPRAMAEPAAVPEQSTDKSPERIGREELYEDIKDAAPCTRVFLAMTVLSAIVAAIGLQHNSVAIIIGAMVIAPLLGPNMALALGAALGDLELVRRAVLTNLAGIGLATVLSIAIGGVIDVDPTLTEVASRTHVGMGDIVLALASGCAGALAFTTGVSATLIGVMVAVALLPPLVTFGLLSSGKDPSLAIGALVLFLVNLTCVNLAAVTTFLVQGIRPGNWWEKARAAKATRIAIAVEAGLLVVLVGIIYLLRKG
jgi:uncharacterized hydrophobic protein (TIGR00341 family)